MQREQRLADAAIEQNPRYFITTSLRRALFLWTGYWSFDRTYLSEESMDLPNIPMCTAFTVLALMGLVKAFRRGQPWAFVFASAMLSFPLVFYATRRSTITGVRWTRSWWCWRRMRLFRAQKTS